LISIDPKPDIILILVNNQNNKDFFTCLTYLEENKNLEFDIEDFIKNKAKFNNLLQIDNQEIIDNINNHFRIVFLKDYILASFLSDSQTEELNTYLMLHSNTVVCYINSIVGDKLANIEQLIIEQTAATQNFFSELFYLLRFSFVELRGNFCQVFTQNGLHLKVLDILFKILEEHKLCPQSEYSIEEQKRFEHKVRLCMEIINFVCKNYAQATPEIFRHEGPSGSHPTLLDMLPELIENHQTELSNQLLDVFQMQIAMRMDILDESFQKFVAGHVVPSVSAKIKALAEAGELQKSTKYIKFAIELFLSFFSLHINALAEVLVRENVLDQVADVLAPSHSKFNRLVFLKYLREILISTVDKSSVSFKKPFMRMWSVYLEHKRRDNVIKGVLLAIIKSLYDSVDTMVLKTFMRIIRKYQDVIKKEPLLIQVVVKYDALKLNLKDQNLNLTSESESSMTQETKTKGQLKIKESFLEDANDFEFGPDPSGFNSPVSIDRKQKDIDSMKVLSLVEKLKKNKAKKEEEDAAVGITKIPRPKEGPFERPKSPLIHIDENLLRKREEVDRAEDERIDADPLVNAQGKRQKESAGLERE
jgi:hypothetical protein